MSAQSVDAGTPVTASSASGTKALLIAGLLALFVLAAWATLTLNGYYVFVLANVALLAVIGIGMNVLIGLSGQISFGHVGFYAVGAYVVAILTQAGVSFWLAWPAAAIVASLLGILLALPTLRVKGPYLAMVTIAFGFVVEHSIVEMRSLTGGQNGIMGIAAPALGSLARGERAVTLLALAAVALVLAGYVLLARGTWGAAMRAVRDSETASASIGINPLVIKTVAFAVSAACAGLAGGLFAPLSGFVTPHTFGFSQSILFVLVVMIGGAGSVMGPIIGAIIVGLLPELLSSLEDFRLLFFGALLLVVQWVAPGGVAGLWSSLMDRIGFIPRAAPQKSGTRVMPVSPLASRARQPLNAEAIGIGFGGVRAVNALSFEAKPGQVTSLIGPNGAGKTSAMNILSGFYAPDSGTFRLGDRALGGASATVIARAGIARTYQTSQLFGSLSVIDNILLAMIRGRLGSLLGGDRLRAGSARAQAQALLVYCGFNGDVLKPAADLPHVDRRIVEIARALALDPDVLLLDEPAAGLSSEDKSKLSALLRRIADVGIAVVVVEHDMTLVMKISDKIVVLDAGQRLAVGTPEAIQADPLVRQAYLGNQSAALPTVRENKERASNDELLGVSALVAGYGAEPVLHGIDIQVRRGEIVALLGANGAGKSTLMRVLSGLHRPVTSGGVTLEGHDLTRCAAEDVVALGMVLSPEGRQVFPELSVVDNLRLGAFLAPQDREARVEQMLTRFPRLRERMDQRAGTLSGGEQQMLAIGRALMSRPRILLLDEPSLGLAPKIVAELFAVLDQLRQDDMTLLLVDQMAELALSLADRAYVLENGRIVAHGPAHAMRRDPALVRAYLGSA